MRALSVCALAMIAAACQSPARTASVEPLDPFVVGIDAQRWGVIIDKAQEGVVEAPFVDTKLEESNILQTDTALKSGAAKLIVLRNDVCRRDLLSAKECGLSSWPAWTMEPPSSTTPLEVLDKRSAWLGETMQRFTDVGCTAGRKASGDEQFCSVE
jgi:hypothetical protein